MSTRLVKPDRKDGPLSREEFLALMEIEAKKLERFARELREGKWETYNIKEDFTRDGGPGQERATITMQASRLQAHGAGRTVMTDGEESPPPRAHHFEGSWQPGERRGVENERYEVTCLGCGLTIIDPTDAYPVDYFPAVVALTPEWLALMSYPIACVPKQASRPTVIEASGLRAERSEQANGMPGNGEHQDEQGARKAQASELSDFAVTREPIDKRTGNGDEHRDESGHG